MTGIKIADNLTEVARGKNILEFLEGKWAVLIIDNNASCKSLTLMISPGIMEIPIALNRLIMPEIANRVHFIGKNHLDTNYNPRDSLS